MVCIQCGSATQVTNSRPQKRLNQVWRRRECLQCSAIFTTEESAQYDAVWRVRSTDGDLQPFLRDKLLLSLYNSCQHRPTAIADAGALTATVINKLLNTTQGGLIDRADIIKITTVALNRFDKAASTHYQAFHRS